MGIETVDELVFLLECSGLAIYTSIDLVSHSIFSSVLISCFTRHRLGFMFQFSGFLFRHQNRETMKPVLWMYRDLTRALIEVELVVVHYTIGAQHMRALMVVAGYEPGRIAFTQSRSEAPW